MFCDRCGVMNPAARTLCIHCMGPLSGTASEAGAMCAEHPGEPATGRCVTCKKLVCEACGGVVGNRGVYCIDHTPAVTTSASASPGMNPLLSGGAPEAAAAGARARASMDRGTMALIAGIVALLVYFGIAFGFPGDLKSGELPTQPPSAAPGPAGFGAGPGASDPYGGTGGYGAPGGYPGPGPGGYPGPMPGGPGGGPSYSAAPYPGPGAPPGGPMPGPAGSGR
jgi:hypothetical protein